MTHAARRPYGTSNERNAAYELLVACTRAGLVTDVERVRYLLEQTSTVVLLGLADYHGIGGLVYERLRQIGAPESILGELQRQYASAVRNHLLAIWDLRRLQPRLDAEKLNWAIVKGPVVVETLHGVAPGRRRYFDLDLVVDPRRFEDVIRILEHLDARLLDQNWKLLRDENRGDVHLLLSGGMPINLHWHLIRKDRGPMRVSTSEVLARVRRVNVGGVLVPTLDATDGLLHLALDAALSGGDRLVSLKDIEVASAVWQPDWDALVGRAHEWNVHVPVGLMLARARMVLGAPIPSEVILALANAPIRAVARLVDSVSPWQFGIGRELAPTRLLAAGVGQGLLGAPAWVTGRVIHALNPWRPAHDSPFTRRGGRRDREAFFEHAARTEQ